MRKLFIFLALLFSFIPISVFASQQEIVAPPLQDYA